MTLIESAVKLIRQNGYCMGIVCTACCCYPNHNCSSPEPSMETISHMRTKVAKEFLEMQDPRILMELLL